MQDRWAAPAKAKLGTMPTARLLIEAMASARLQNHTFTKYDGQPHAELLDLEDEVRELGAAIRDNEGEVAVRNEMGDVMFSVLNMCRAYGIDFDEALDAFATRWLNRKATHEEHIFAQGYTWQTVPTDVNDAVWQSVKKQLKQQENQA
jgi:uncharacterized protein YabN with tetrapyrrole methylase and pyrophosphatase domain